MHEPGLAPLRERAARPGELTAADFIATLDEQVRATMFQGILRRASVVAREVILELVTHGERHPVWLPNIDDSRTVMVVGGEVRPGGIDKLAGKEWHTRALLEILTVGERFVFRRCPVCGRIWAKRGRQERCSLRCTQVFHDAKRKTKPERREQNRIAAKKYRDEKKRREEKQRKGV